MMPMFKSPYLKKGVSLIEVIFAIGVVLVGLVGLLAIMPLAGRRSQEAISLSAAAAMGDAVLNSLQSKRLLHQMLGAPQMVDLNSAALRDMSTNEKSIVYNVNGQQLATLELVTPPPPTPPTIVETAVTSGICLDPLYKGSQGSLTQASQYDDSLFPYFAASHHLLSNPSDSTLTWPSQPRLLRVGLFSPVTATANARLENAKTFVERNDDLVVTRPKDRSANAVLQGLSSGSSLNYGRRVPSGELSWIVTINPLPSSRFASVAVVIIRKRDFAKDFPSSAVTTPDENGVSERVAYVCWKSGFVGGSGGSVILASSETTASALRSNDWLMLSRRTPIGDFHRWYRVVGVNGKARTSVTDGEPTSYDTFLKGRLPTASTGIPVWFHEVQLDGPDWDFGFEEPPAAETFDNNTYATLISNVVSVTERVIPLSDL